jgi:hypothetical protein
VPDFTFQSCERAEGAGPYRVDLAGVAGAPEVTPHVEPGRANLVIYFADGSDTGPWIASREEVGRFVAALGAYRGPKA